MFYDIFNIVAILILAFIGTYYNIKMNQTGKTK